MEWDIGSEARELDEKSFSERAKLEKRSLKKFTVAFLVYFSVMTLFYFLL